MSRRQGADGHDLRRCRPDGQLPAGVIGLAEAPQIYEHLSRGLRMAVLVEVSAIGQKGLPVNQSQRTSTLETLPGTFRMVQLACLIEVGDRQVLKIAVRGLGRGERRCGC